MRPWSFITVALVAALALAAGCTNPQSSPQPGASLEELNVGLTGTVNTLDYAKAASAVGATVISLGVEHLMVLDADGVVGPHLAESVDQPDPTTYVYSLRQGVEFWNGNELTAADVVYSLNHARGEGSQLAQYFMSVRDIKATDRHTVTVRLKHPDATWKYTPAFAPIFEKKFAEEHKDELGNPGVLIMATGPWEFTSLAPTRGVELARNENYWGETPTIEKVSIKFLSDETSMAVAFRSGEIDVAFPRDARAFESTAGTELVVSGPTCSAAFLSMNVKLEPWSDVHVRRAVAHAVDREGIAKALNGAVTPIEQLIPRQMWEGIASDSAADELYGSLPVYEFDLDKARAELAESEYPDGFSATINASSNVRETSIVNQAIAANLKKIGIDLQVKNVPSSQWLEQFYGPRKDIPVFMIPSGCGTTPDPSWYPSLWLSSANATEGGTNIADYTDATVDDLANAGLRTDNPDERLEIYGDLLRRVARDVPYVPLYSIKVYVALADGLEWPGFSDMYVEQPWADFVKAKAQ